MSRRHSMIAALCLAAVLFVASARGQGLIEMKSVARVAPGSPVTLADVATLSGDEAIALAHIEVLPAAPAPSRLTIAQLRRRLGEERGVNWGRITLRGSTCTVQALDPAPKSAAPTPRVGTPAVPDPNSVRQAVSDRIARILQAGARDLRLTFDAADDEFLNQTTTGRTLEIKPTASSDRLPLALTLYEGDRIVASRSIRVGVLVRRNVVIAAASKSRGETIAESDVTIDEQWVGPNVNAAAQGRIAAGQVILSGSIVAPMVVNKGEIVSVSCVSGTVVLTTKARALASARVGDVIQFQGLDDKRTFTARMSGRGRAVVVVETSEDRT
jgi:flagella basal body P-ring formation protein FlgA